MTTIIFFIVIVHYLLVFEMNTSSWHHHRRRRNMFHSNTAINSFMWIMYLGRWLQGGIWRGVFCGVEYFLLVCSICMGLSIGWVVGGGGGAVSVIIQKQQIIPNFLDMNFFELSTSRIARPCLSSDLWRRNRWKIKV